MDREREERRERKGTMEELGRDSERDGRRERGMKGKMKREREKNG